jgi:kinesin family protein 11
MSNFMRPTQRSRAMPPPSATRRPLNRAQTATPSFGGRASPADSVASTRRQPSPGFQVGGKRKERDYDHDSAEGANINVVVRCRGRNDREVRENSGVVVATDGLKGKTVELSMGPSALSNKTYTFDKVFSPAADQIMVFDEVVTPILDEVCTSFSHKTASTDNNRSFPASIAQFSRTVRPAPARHIQCPATSQTHYLFQTTQA